MTALEWDICSFVFNPDGCIKIFLLDILCIAEHLVT
jgi:hypothetical protein